MGRLSKLDIEHDKEGYRRYGKERWERANIGWYGEEGLIASKVYGNPTVIFISTRGKKNHIYHSEEEYSR